MNKIECENVDVNTEAEFDADPSDLLTDLTPSALDQALDRAEIAQDARDRIFSALVAEAGSRIVDCAKVVGITTEFDGSYRVEMEVVGTGERIFFGSVQISESQLAELKRAQCYDKCVTRLVIRDRQPPGIRRVARFTIAAECPRLGPF